MSTHLAASPVAEALFALLTLDATLEALAPGGIHDDVPQDPTYPHVWLELLTETDRRGLGTGSLPELELRVHVFAVYPGKRTAQAIVDRVIALLKDTALTITGWTQAGLVFYDSTTTLAPDELDGVTVHELVAAFRIYAEAP